MNRFTICFFSSTQATPQAKERGRSQNRQERIQIRLQDQQMVKMDRFRTERYCIYTTISRTFHLGGIQYWLGYRRLFGIPLGIASWTLLDLIWLVGIVCWWKLIHSDLKVRHQDHMKFQGLIFLTKLLFLRFFMKW